MGTAQAPRRQATAAPASMHCILLLMRQRPGHGVRLCFRLFLQILQQALVLGRLLQQYWRGRLQTVDVCWRQIKACGQIQHLMAQRRLGQIVQVQADEIGLDFFTILVAHGLVDFAHQRAKAPQRLLRMLVDRNVDDGVERIGKPRNGRAFVDVADSSNAT